MHSERVHAGSPPHRGSAYRSAGSPGRRGATSSTGPEGRHRGLCLRRQGVHNTSHPGASTLAALEARRAAWCTHAGVSRPALAYVGMALHEAPFNEDAEQRPLGEVKTIDTAAYHLAATAARPPKGRSSYDTCYRALPSRGVPRPLLRPTAYVQTMAAFYLSVTNNK